MTLLQEDILGIYNSLTDFSKETLQTSEHLPIRVQFSETLNSVCFEQKGRKIAIGALNYFCKDLKNIKETYLLPVDYDYLMSSLLSVIKSGALLHDRVCICPEKYGFKIYETDPYRVQDGPKIIADIKIISGNSWLFRQIVKRKFKDKL